GRPAHRPFRGLLGVHSRCGLHTRAVTVIRDPLSEGFRHFVSSMPAPVASGWSESPGGACTHWKAPPYHGAHQLRTVRQGALSLLVRSAPETELGEIAEKFLDDPWPEMRHAAAQALGARGETAVFAICGQLRRGSEDAQLAAIDALHLAIGPAAADRLFDE